jgi:hypothetical protein
MEKLVKFRTRNFSTAELFTEAAGKKILAVSSLR